MRDNIKSDISCRRDIEKLIQIFYARMLDDIIIGFIFTQVAKVDLDKHLPIICDFWETILFQIPKYDRGTEIIEVHLNINSKIPLKKGHFTRWLYLFHSTVDELFKGKNAERSKEKADAIAQSIQKKLSLI